MGTNRSYSWSFTFGALIVAAGVVLLLDQQGLINADRVLSYFWPIVMIGAGSAMVIDCHGRGGEAFSAAFCWPLEFCSFLKISVSHMSTSIPSGPWSSSLSAY